MQEVTGLSEKEALLKKTTIGSNALLDKGELEESSLLLKYIQQFNNPLILLLLASAFISFLLGQLENGISIVIAVTIVTTFAFVQENRSEASLKALHKLSPPQCLVIRDGKVRQMLAEELVPGDIVRLLRGSRVPADLLLDSGTSDLCVDESMFTGESVPVPKQIGSKLLMGTMIIEGNGQGHVTSTGRQTELGKLTNMMRETEESKTPLQSQLDSLGAKLSIWSGVVILGIALIGWFQGQSLLHIFTTAVSLAVAAIPEGLPIVATITLALGILRLAKRGVLVKKLTAVEGLGSIQVLCVDKTGTLTQNCLALDKTISFGEESEENLLRIAASCTDKSSSLDSLLLEKVTSPLYPNVELLQPFSSDTKWMAVRTSEDQKENNFSSIVIAKGAIDCLPLTKLNPELKKQVEDLGREGNRVLGIASGPSLNELGLLGLLCFKDEPRPGISTTVTNLSALGVRLVMITGDSKETAEAIGRSIDWPEGDSISGSVVGDQLSHSTSIIYRATPKQKLQIIEILQHQHKQIVSMIGDGVNDAAALKKADIGVAMGGPRGTDVAREAARIVLTDDNLASLVTGIREGRNIFRNIRSFIKFQISVSMALLLVVAHDSFSGLPPLLSPFQILLINIIMDGPPAQSLGVEPEDLRHGGYNVVKGESLLTLELFVRSILSALVTVMISVSGRNVFNTLVLVTLANAFCCRSFLESSLRVSRLFANKALMLAISVSIISLLIIDIIKHRSTPLQDWIFGVASAAAYVIVDEFVKIVHKQLLSKRLTSPSIPLISLV
jgi:P-type Ca2+ transporter type 2C